MKGKIPAIVMVPVLCLGLAAAVIAQQEFPRGGAPSNPAAAGNTTVAAQLNQQLSFVETEFVDAADAMPQDKYAFVPMSEFPNSSFRGVRNFAQQVLHVAGANYQLYGAIIPDEPRQTAPPPNTAEGRAGSLCPPALNSQPFYEYHSTHASRPHRPCETVQIQLDSVRV